MGLSKAGHQFQLGWTIYWNLRHYHRRQELFDEQMLSPSFSICSESDLGRQAGTGHIRCSV